MEKEVLSFYAFKRENSIIKDRHKSMQSSKETKNEKPNVIKDTFDIINRDQDFSECCARGKPEDIEKLGNILKQDPKKLKLDIENKNK